MTLGTLSVVAITLAFAALVFAVYRPGARDRIEGYGRIPVDEPEAAGRPPKEDPNLE